MQRVIYRSVYFVQKNSRNNHKCPECISKLQHKPWPAKLYYDIEDDHVLNQRCGGFHTCALLGKKNLMSLLTTVVILLTKFHMILMEMSCWRWKLETCKSHRTTKMMAEIGYGMRILINQLLKRFMSANVLVNPSVNVTIVLWTKGFIEEIQLNMKSFSAVYFAESAKLNDGYTSPCKKPIFFQKTNNTLLQ